MKTKKIIIAVIGCMAGAVLTSCQSKEEKVHDAQENVIEAKQDLSEAQREYREEQDKRLRENEKSIEEYRLKINDQKEADRAAYQSRIDDLERRNKDMRVKLDTYNDPDESKWENFKNEFNHDMEELGNAFRDMGKNNVNDKK
jgi:vacuolar-type H+-ATPase subunit H